MTPDPITKLTPDPITVLVDAVRVRELTRVLAALEDEGARPIVFKGAALAYTHYQHSWDRPRLDADILIADVSRQGVCARLCELGYERPTFISGDFVMYQAPFIRTDHLGVEHILDIHWRVANPQVLSRVVTHDELVARAATVDVQGYAMRVPSAVDALMLACIHRAAHHDDSEDPVWLHDIHLLATSLAAVEWSTFVERASARSVMALCARGLNLARDRCRTAVPPEVVAALATSRREASALFLRKDVRPVERLVADVRALGPRAAARLLREHLFPPAAYMRAAYGISAGAFLPAYYALRAVKGVSKWVGNS